MGVLTSMEHTWFLRHTGGGVVEVSPAVRWSAGSTEHTVSLTEVSFASTWLQVLPALVHVSPPAGIADKFSSSHDLRLQDDDTKYALLDLLTATLPCAAGTAVCFDHQPQKPAGRKACAIPDRQKAGRPAARYETRQRPASRSAPAQ